MRLKTREKRRVAQREQGRMTDRQRDWERKGMRTRERGRGRGRERERERERESNRKRGVYCSMMLCILLCASKRKNEHSYVSHVIGIMICQYRL